VRPGAPLIPAVALVMTPLFLIPRSRERTDTPVRRGGSTEKSLVTHQRRRARRACGLRLQGWVPTQSTPPCASTRAAVAPYSNKYKVIITCSCRNHHINAMRVLLACVSSPCSVVTCFLWWVIPYTRTCMHARRRHWHLMQDVLSLQAYNKGLVEVGQRATSCLFFQN
jgi:hypothetical protein